MPRPASTTTTAMHAARRRRRVRGLVGHRGANIRPTRPIRADERRTSQRHDGRHRTDTRAAGGAGLQPFARPPTRPSTSSATVRRRGAPAASTSRARSAPRASADVRPGRPLATPTAIFTNKYQSPPNCERCWLTVHSLAQNLSVPIDFDHGYPAAIGGNQGAADTMKAAAKSHSVILASWGTTASSSSPPISACPRSQSRTGLRLRFGVRGDARERHRRAARLPGRRPAVRTEGTTCPPKYVPPPGEPTYVSEEKAAMAETGA